MKRSEIWTSAGGAPFTEKPRPVLIVQANVYDATTSITVCGITSDPTETSFTRPPLAPSDLNGLRTRSRVMVDKITTVPRHRLRHKIGVVSSDDMFEVETALALFLAIPS